MKLKKLLPLLFVPFVFISCSNDTTEVVDEPDIILTELIEPVEFVFWHAMAGTQQEMLIELTNRFMAEHPDINVILQNQSSYKDLQQKLTLNMASPKQLPNITQAYPNWMETALIDNLLVDLTPYIEDPIVGYDNYEDILQGFRDATEIDGKIYSIPFNKSTEVLWYNKTLFDELGLTPPTNYEELAETAKIIHDKKGIVGAGFDSLSNYYTTYLYNHGKLLDSDLDVMGPESREAVQYYLDGINDGYFRIAGTDNFLSGPFGNELIGMYIGSNAGESFVIKGAGDKFEVGVAPYPAEVVMQQGTDIFMFNPSTKEQRLAAFEYLKYLTSTDSQVDWAVATGYIPVRISAMETPTYITSGSLIAPIVEETTDSLYTTAPDLATDSAYRESATVLETILAQPDEPDVDGNLQRYHDTLLGVWE
ncbi:MAG: sugar ABC transporter substrate-binding protein [Candidatus Epulonipiscioides saccharophilum]|nr:MAG: sugar ABC transporter substrate-binding protein [Epulopiscium sp. AS2M-Bin001]